MFLFTQTRTRFHRPRNTNHHHFPQNSIITINHLPANIKRRIVQTSIDLSSCSKESLEGNGLRPSLSRWHLSILPVWSFSTGLTACPLFSPIPMSLRTTPAIPTPG